MKKGAEVPKVTTHPVMTVMPFKKDRAWSVIKVVANIFLNNNTKGMVIENIYCWVLGLQYILAILQQHCLATAKVKNNYYLCLMSFILPYCSGQSPHFSILCHHYWLLGIVTIIIILFHYMLDFLLLNINSHLLPMFGVSVYCIVISTVFFPFNTLLRFSFSLSLSIVKL